MPLRIFSAVVAVMMLCACGGGSESGGPQIALDFIPGAVTSSYYSGDKAEFYLEVTSRGDDVSGELFIYVVDAEGILDGPPEIVQYGPGMYYVFLTFSPSLAPGSHVGNFKIQMCGTANCSTSYRVLPDTLPYDVTVTSSTNLTSLATLSGASDWVTYQGTASHTGYVPVTLDPAVFSPRWIHRAPRTENFSPALTAAVASGGLVYVAGSRTANFFHRDLIALRDSDGSVAWSDTLNWMSNSYDMVCPPALYGGSVFMMESDGYFIKANATTGATEFSTPFNENVWYCNAPTGVAGKIYTTGTNIGALSQFDAATGELDWSYQEAGGVGTLSPAVDASYIYGYGGHLELYDTTGVMQSSIADTGEWSDGPFREFGSPVLSGGMAFAVAQGHLTAFDLANSAVSWTVPGRFVSNPTVANGVVYVTNESPLRVEARSVADGALLWTWTPPTETNYFLGDLIATNNLLFVSTDTQINALSLTTHLTAWTYTRPGRMALSSSGLLYITRYDPATQRSDGTLAAINLH